MSKKKPLSVVGMIGEAVSDVVDAASVAATGSQLGVLELAAEQELRPAAPKRKRKAKAARKTSKAKTRKTKTSPRKSQKKKKTTTTKRKSKTKKRPSAKRSRR